MKLSRSRNGMIGGVAAGIAAYLKLDPTIIRIAFVLISLFAGGGLLIYGILWIVIPKEGEDSTLAEEGLHKARDWYDGRKGGDGH
ncbi:phage shock protein C (PspC) family protein [Tessaracoccus bendigoensis DSM 12906]|uniref:Phage shock protein C (PspC) family protein n=1 Tax=Tessaracoccus bendigoensis DSM 12906 TaxID=1123357 RepID=A0A1M6FD54_9ACTN|nr:PspC domain-containing protein [Tessaracoccus bendigoensis]SHI95549.1 phage shock protein C (PspC) family protein [Tessaracoccus bendigoensis DSM 12906]